MEPQLLNLIYHVTPFSSSSVWQRNVSQLLRRIDVFNGKRVIGVAVPPGGGQQLASLGDVQAAFNGHRIDHWVTANNCDQKWRESPTFYPMMDKVKSTDPEQATFYGHAKGTTRSVDDKNVTNWRNSMYHHLLDDMDKVKQMLESHPCVGTFRQYNAPGTLRVHTQLSKEILQRAKWHYAGTFFWFRNDSVFNRADWRDVPMHGWAVEFYLPFLFNYDEAACLYNDSPKSPYSYQPESHPDPDDWQKYLPSDGKVKVELGGGMNPRTDGYINVDQLSCADITMDLQEVASGNAQLPFPDDTVDTLYAAHVVEHLSPAIGLLHEIARVCKVGAEVEIRVPHWLHSYGMSDSLDTVFTGHRHTWGRQWIYLLCDEPGHQRIWPGSKKFKILHTHYEPEVHFKRAKELFPKFTDEDIFRFVPETVHEVRYKFSVVNKT